MCIHIHILKIWQTSTSEFIRNQVNKDFTGLFFSGFTVTTIVSSDCNSRKAA